MTKRKIRCRVTPVTDLCRECWVVDCEYRKSQPPLDTPTTAYEKLLKQRSHPFDKTKKHSM